MATRQHSGHLPALDGLRGIAACAVVFYHFHVSTTWFTHAYLAVDFFFVLSGYVIGLAYERRLENDLSLPGYMLLRLERLMPMLVLGALLGLATIRFATVDDYLIPAEGFSPVLALAAQIFMIPFALSKAAFILNLPQWSIIFEIGINAFHAAFIRFLNNFMIVFIITISAILIFWTAKNAHTIDFGWGIDNFLKGIPRVTFGFFFGLLLFRTREAWSPRLPSLPFCLIGLILLLVLAMPNLPALAWHGGKRDIVSALIAFPLIVALGVKATGGGSFALGLGVLSYPLYAIHMPLVYGTDGLQRVLGLPEGPRTSALHASAIIVIVLTAYAVGRYIDLPVNRWRRSQRKQPTTPRSI